MPRSDHTLSTRRAAKRMLERVLLGAAVERIGLHAHRRRTLVLAYHNVVPDGERPCGERSLHIPRHAFAAQLDALAATHEVVPLSAIDEAPHSGRPRAILTFDDAYRGALSVGLPELERRGMPATVFVAPGLFGTTAWWDRLAESRGGALAEDLRSNALEAGRGRAETIPGLARARAVALPEWASIAGEDEVRAAAARRHVTLGAHTWTHANLPVLDAGELAVEFARPLHWLRSVQPTVAPWLAYPYGRSTSAVARAAHAAGYAGAFCIDGGWLPDTPRDPASRFALPRLNVPADVTLAGFRLRAAGLLVR